MYAYMPRKRHRRKKDSSSEQKQETRIEIQVISLCKEQKESRRGVSMQIPEIQYFCRGSVQRSLGAARANAEHRRSVVHRLVFQRDSVGLAYAIPVAICIAVCERGSSREVGQATKTWCAATRPDGGAGKRIPLLELGGCGGRGWGRGWRVIGDGFCMQLNRRRTGRARVADAVTGRHRGLAISAVGCQLRIMAALSGRWLVGWHVQAGATCNLTV